MDLRGDGGDWYLGGSKGLKETGNRVRVVKEIGVSMCDRLEMGILHS